MARLTEVDTSSFKLWEYAHNGFQCFLSGIEGFCAAVQASNFVLDYATRAKEVLGHSKDILKALHSHTDTVNDGVWHESEELPIIAYDTVGGVFHLIATTAGFEPKAQWINPNTGNVVCVFVITGDDLKAKES